MVIIKAQKFNENISIQLTPKRNLYRNYMYGNIFR